MLNAGTGRARFPRAIRLTRPADFQRVFRRAAKSSDACFTVLGVTNRLGHARLGLAISRKMARSAVVRNRVKRVIRESYRQHQDELVGLDIVVLARSRIGDVARADMRASLTMHWSTLVARCAKFS